MAGAEVASFILAVLPLVISAAEHYHEVLQPFSRYRKFAHEVDHFQSALKTQQTIFRNECRLLLTCAGAAQAREMLDDSAHPGWRDQSIDMRLMEHLGDSKSACVDTIAAIMDRLKDVEQEERQLGEVVAQDKKLESVGDKAWRRRVGKKLKFSFSKSRLDQNLASLKALNEDFATLAAQADRMADRRLTTLPTASRIHAREIEKFQIVQRTSLQLYEALGSACTKHTEHQAHFSLQPSLNGASSLQVRFSIAFRHFAMGGSASPGGPIWFAVESIINETTVSAPIEVCNALSDLGRSLKRQEMSPSLEKAKGQKKCVRFRSPSPPLKMLPPSPDMSLPNLCMHGNFCNQIMNCLRQSPQKASTCIGLLEKSATCKHLVYLGSPLGPANSQEGMSLSKLFSSVANRNMMGGLPIYERLRLSKLLATAVLQFHATPWLKGSWRSDDVLFFGVDPTAPSQLSNLTAPYMNVSVKGPDGTLSRAPTFPSRVYVRNPLLFGLGVILLELSFDAPLKSMQQPIDLENGQEDRHTEFFTAERVSRATSTQMGPAFAQIVRKCLHCDFGRGDDLNDPALQEGFYREVVCELARLEEKFRELQLGV